METLNIGNYILQIDREKTLEFYNKNDNTCDCEYCTNYKKVLGSIPKEALEIFGSLGIIPGRVSEVIEIGQGITDEKKRYYQIVCAAAGSIVSAPDNTETIVQNKEQIVVEKMPKIGNVEYRFADWFDLIPANFPNPKFSVELFFDLPWIE